MVGPPAGEGLDCTRCALHFTISVIAPLRTNTRKRGVRRVKSSRIEKGGCPYVYTEKGGYILCSRFVARPLSVIATYGSTRSPDAPPFFSDNLYISYFNKFRFRSSMRRCIRVMRSLFLCSGTSG